jgi:hypothetical protein
MFEGHKLHGKCSILADQFSRNFVATMDGRGSSLLNIRLELAPTEFRTRVATA